MEFITAVFVLMTVSNNSFDEQKIGPEGFERMEKLYPYVRQVERNTDVPPRVILGTIYKESVGIPDVTGDGGLSYGLGQIRCFWIHQLDVPLDRCRELLVDWKNVYMMGQIFHYLHEKFARSWRQTMKLYHLGIQVVYEDIDDSRYLDRSTHFGKIFLGHYQATNKVNDTLFELASEVRGVVDVE